MNGMIALMMAKFMMNDVPHALGFQNSSSFPWVNEAWYKLNAYAISHGIQFFSPQEAYSSMIEHRMPVNDIKRKPLSDSVRSIILMYERTLREEQPNWKLPTRQELENLRAYMAGYHLIAVGEASDTVVNDVYYLIKDRFLRFARAYESGPSEVTEFEVQTGTVQWYKDLKTTANLFIGDTRADKVIAIDAVAHLLHEYEPRTLVEDLFAESHLLASFNGTPIWVALGQMFDIWFGIDPRRVISLAEYIGEEA